MYNANLEHHLPCLSPEQAKEINGIIQLRKASGIFQEQSQWMIIIH